MDDISYFFCEFFGTCLSTSEDDITTLDVCHHIFIASLLEKGFEIFHIDHPLATHIYTAENGYIGIHIGEYT
jgi:hypothetical protein